MNLTVPVDLIEIGCSVFALDLNTQTDADARDVKGGVVVSIETGTNPTTGEIQRRFITATPWRREIRFDSLLADHVVQAEPPNSASIWTLIRTAAGVVANAKKRGSDTARCIALQHHLMEVL